jgi:hypothetical protein
MPEPAPVPSTGDVSMEAAAQSLRRWRVDGNYWLVPPQVARVRKYRRSLRKCLQILRLWVESGESDLRYYADP